MSSKWYNSIFGLFLRFGTQKTSMGIWFVPSRLIQRRSRIPQLGAKIFSKQISALYPDPSSNFLQQHKGGCPASGAERDGFPRFRSRRIGGATQLSRRPLHKYVQEPFPCMLRWFYGFTSSRFCIPRKRPGAGQYQTLFSLQNEWILTTRRCSHYPINECSLPDAVLTTGSMNSLNEFSLPDAVPTTGSMNSHYQTLLTTGSMNPHAQDWKTLFSLPNQWILTTRRCSHYPINELSLPDVRYRINKSSLPAAVLTTQSMNSHYQTLFSLPDQWTLASQCQGTCEACLIFFVEPPQRKKTPSARSPSPHKKNTNNFHCCFSKD